MSNKVLAAAVGLAPSTCHTRIARLTEEGVLLGVRAVVSPKALGVQLETLVAVRLADHGEKQTRRVIEFLSSLPEVIDLYLVAGQVDLVVHVAVRDTEHLRRIVFESIGARDEIADVTTSLIYVRHAALGYPDLLPADQ